MMTFKTIAMGLALAPPAGFLIYTLWVSKRHARATRQALDMIKRDPRVLEACNLIEADGFSLEVKLKGYDTLALCDIHGDQALRYWDEIRSMAPHANVALIRQEQVDSLQMDSLQMDYKAR